MYKAKQSKTCFCCNIDDYLMIIPLTHLGILPPWGSWWWNCSTMTVTTTDIPTIIMVLAKYWAVSADKNSTIVLLLVTFSCADPTFSRLNNSRIRIHRTCTNRWNIKKDLDSEKRLISCSHMKGEASLIDLRSRLFCRGEKMSICSQTGEITSV